MIYALTAFFGVLAATFTDLKGRVIPNELNYLLLFLGLSLHLIESFTTNSLNPILFSASGAIICFVAGYVLWKLGAWAGGDVKLFAALGALIPLPYGSVPSFYNSFPLFPFLVLINALILSFPFIMFYVFFLSFTKKHLRKQAKVIAKKTLEKAVVYACILFSFNYFFTMLSLPSWLTIIPLILIVFIPYKKIVSIGLAVIALILGQNVAFIGTSFISFLFISGFFQAMTYGRKHVLVDVIPVNKLEEGMISAQTLYVSSKNSVKEYSPSFQELIKNPLFEPARTIVSSARACGITDKEIAKLKKNGVKSLKVKKSVPLVPIVLLGLIASLLLGDLLWIGVKYL